MRGIELSDKGDCNNCDYWRYCTREYCKKDYFKEIKREQVQEIYLGEDYNVYEENQLTGEDEY